MLEIGLVRADQWPSEFRAFRQQIAPGHRANLRNWSDHTGLLDHVDVRSGRRWPMQDIDVSIGTAPTSRASSCNCICITISTPRNNKINLFHVLSFARVSLARRRTPILYADNESYAINATVFDLDPKLYTKHFKKYVEKTKESYHAVGQYSVLWFYITIW